MLIEASLSEIPRPPIVAASGLAGYGGTARSHSRRPGQSLHLRRRIEQCPKGITPMAPPRRLVASLQANLVVELLVKMRGHHV